VVQPEDLDKYTAGIPTPEKTKLWQEPAGEVCWTNHFKVETFDYSAEITQYSLTVWEKQKPMRQQRGAADASEYRLLEKIPDELFSCVCPCLSG
jgi:hypothetical protein